MIKYLVAFFNPREVIYSYNLSPECVIHQIRESLKAGSLVFGNKDFGGRFLSDNTFEMATIPFAYTTGFKLNSRLMGRIVEIGSGETRVLTKARPSPSLYVVLFVSFSLGTVYLFNSIQTNSVSSALLAAIVVIAGTTIPIWISNVANAIIHKRFKIFIDKKLRDEATAANTGLSAIPATE